MNGLLHDASTGLRSPTSLVLEKPLLRIVQSALVLGGRAPGRSLGSMDRRSELGALVRSRFGVTDRA
jgi:hypothetical protein